MVEKVSIIIPIYNAENSINRAIKSIQNQTYKAIEIILVNDGSIDNSASICNQFAGKDARITVIHQQNQGPSAARNAGIQAATGAFIQFLDADDYIHPQMIEKLVPLMRNDVDLAICGYQSITNKNTIIETYTPAIKDKWSLTTFMNHVGQLYKQIILPSLCNKLYRTQKIQKAHIHFNENVKMGEDLLFNLNYIKQCKQIHLLAEPLYYYVAENNSSLSSIFHEDLFENQNMLHQQVNKILTENDCYSGENKYFLDIIYTNSIMNSLNNIFHPKSTIPRNKRKTEIQKILNNEYLNEVIETSVDNRPQTQVIKHLIKQKSTIGLSAFILLKQTMLKNTQPLYKWFQQKNKAK